MSTVQENIEAIKHLNPTERAELDRTMRWEFDEWEQQIAADVKSGKLGELLEQVDEDIRAGSLRDLP